MGFENEMDQLNEEKDKILPKNFSKYIEVNCNYPYRFLIVDDFSMVRYQMRNILEKNYSCIVMEAENGKEALLMYKEALEANKSFDLVFLDKTLIELDGMTALKYILEIDKNASVIMTSSLTSKKIVIEALTNGAKHFINKGTEEMFVMFNEKNVVEVIQKVLKLK